MTDLIYLAHPIDFSSSDETLWLAVIRDLVVESGLGYYDPQTAFSLPPTATPTSSVSEINNHALRQCRGMVCVFPNRPGVGTAMELQMAQSLGMPVLVVVDDSVKAHSWALAGLTNARVTGLTDSGDWTNLLDKQKIAADMQWLAQAAQNYAISGTELHSLKVVLDDKRSMIPDRAYSGDAGYDLYTSRDTIIHPHGFSDVPCGVSVQLPPGCWGMITGRSSTLRKHNLLVTTGIIDNGYRGPLYAGIRNMSDEPFRVKVGMRLAQLIPLPLTAASIIPVRVADLDDSDRGSSGFGSSGE